METILLFSIPSRIREQYHILTLVPAAGNEDGCTYYYSRWIHPSTVRVAEAFRHQDEKLNNTVDTIEASPGFFSPKLVLSAHRLACTIPPLELNTPKSLGNYAFWLDPKRGVVLKILPLNPGGTIIQACGQAGDGIPEVHSSLCRSGSSRRQPRPNEVKGQKSEANLSGSE